MAADVGSERRSGETWFIRIVVIGALSGSVVAGILLPVPKPLPSVALGTEWSFYSLRGLGFFYVFLLLFVPLMRAIKGQLPIELSLRGARYEEASAAADALRALDDRWRPQFEAAEGVVALLTETIGKVAELEDEIQRLQRQQETELD